MKTPIFILLFKLFAFGQQAEDKSNVDHGVSLKAVDSSEKENVYILKFDSSKAVVFPASYAKKILGRSEQYNDVIFFKPDSSLVNSALRDQTFRNTIKTHKENGLRKELKKIKKQHKEQLKQHNKLCPLQQEQLKFKDKQLIAFYRSSGDTVLYIQLLDFRQDPYNLKKYFTSSWIDGWHGWFETNTMRLNFHAEKKLVTINETL